MNFKARRIAIGGAAFAVLAAVLVALLFVTAGTARAKQFATLKVFKQGVDVKGVGGSAFQPAKDGQTVRQGDVIRTDATGLANITYFDGSQTRIDHDTAFRVQELSTVQNQARSKVIRTGLDKGKTFNRVVKLTDSESRFETETPTATASVRGTQFVLIVAPGSDLCPGTPVCRLQVTTVEVIDGVVAMITEDGVILVKEGQKVTIFSDGTAGPVEDLTPADLSDPFVTFNQCDVDDQDLARCGGNKGNPPPSPPPGNRAPSASLAASTENGQAPLTVTFTDLSTDPDGDKLSRRWVFGDGSASTAGPSVTHTYDGAGDFPVTLTVRDPGGKSDSIGTVIHVTGDTTPPDTVITSAPPQATDSTTATYGFTATESGPTFVCSFDGSAFSPCSSPFQRSSLANGSHSFAVRATDAAGNSDPSPATDQFAVDTKAPPEPAIRAHPPKASNSRTATFRFGRGSGGARVRTGSGMLAAVAASSGTPEHFECSLDGEPFATCVSPKVVTVGDGAHLMRIRAVDAAGNVSALYAFRWTVELNVPTITVTGRPSNPTNSTVAQIDFEVDDPNAAVTCQLDGERPRPCTSPVSFTDLSDRSHTLLIAARNRIGNVGRKTVSWRVDTKAPDTTITRAPPDPSDVSIATFRFTSTEAGSSFECALDSGPFRRCSSPKSVSGLSEGSHTFQVQATDAAGNTDESPAVRTWTVSFPAGGTPVIVSLRWDNGPSDLDLHVETPDRASDDGGEVWSGNPCHPTGDCDGDWATLDHDGTLGEGSGTESVTIRPQGSGEFFPGTYSFWVENFSCDDGTFSGSGARVVVTQGAATLGSFPVTSASGDKSLGTWIVGRMSITSGGSLSSGPSGPGALDGDDCGGGEEPLRSAGAAIVGTPPGDAASGEDGSPRPAPTPAGTSPSPEPSTGGSGTGDGGSGGPPSPPPPTPTDTAPPPPEPSPTESSPAPTDNPTPASAVADAESTSAGGG